MNLNDINHEAIETPTVKTDVTPPPKTSVFSQSTSHPFSYQSTLKTQRPLSATEVTAWGPYELIRPLGHGAMGSVYEARDPVLDRRIAVKILAAGTGDGQRGAAACLSEARAAAKLDHANIVTVYQIGEHDETGFIAMQLVRGGSAADHLPLSVDESLRVIRAVADALGYAHRQGIVHRDVKPENILLGEDGAAKLADFGLAQFVSVDDPGPRPSRIAGTPVFMSPEQAQGLPLDGRSDLYSLGATWFALLAGEPPFVRPGMLEVLSAHVEVPPPDIRSFRPDTPASVAELIARLLGKRPADRYSSAEELTAALDEIIRERASPGQARATRSPRRSRWQRLALAASLLIAGLGAAVATGTYLANRDHENPAPTEPAAFSVGGEHFCGIEGADTVAPLDREEGRDSKAQAMKVLAELPPSPTGGKTSETATAAPEKNTTAGSAESSNARAPASSQSNGGGRLPLSFFGSLMAATPSTGGTGTAGGFTYFGFSNSLKKPPIRPQGRGQGDHHHSHHK